MSFQRDRALSTAQQHAARGDLVSAIREYQSVVENIPGDAQTWILLADTLHRAGDVDAAVDRYVHAANILLDKGEVPNALQVYRQVLSVAPERYDVHLRTGQAFEQLRRYPEAVALYEKVAGVYLRSGNTREALLLYERVAELMPREIAKRLRLAELFSRERRFDEAVSQFQIGADFLRQAGRTQEYVRVAERLLYHRPVDAVVRELVRAYLELGEPRRALMKLNELLGRVQHDLEGLELLAETFVRMEKVDKACSVVLELVKHHRDEGVEAQRVCVTVLRRAAGWDPKNQKIKQTLDELAAAMPEPATELDEAEEFEDFDEVEEIEEFDEVEQSMSAPVIPEPPAARAAAQSPAPSRDVDSPASRRHTLTEEVINEGAQRSGEDGEVDIDKQLEEVRVLLKYHLFEHALGHAEQVLAAAPDHPQGLELSAEILAALGRNDEAADARAKLAERLIERDPSAAARQVELALALIPKHPLASKLRERISEISGVNVGVADVSDAAPPSTDPLGALDLEDDLLGEIEASDSLIGRVDPSLAEDIGVDHPDASAHVDPLTTVEIDDGEGDIDIGLADPSLHGELSKLASDDDDFAISLDSGETEPEPEDELDFEDRFGLGDDEEDEPEQTQATEQPMVGRVEPEAHAGAEQDEDDRFGASEPEPEPEPEEDWEDLSAELEELDFYLAQDLEEDARAAFNDLVELFPGHPKLRELAPRFGMDLGPAPASASSPSAGDTSSAQVRIDASDELDTSGYDEEAAAPLLDLEGEEDDDDFLAGIFDEDAPKQRKKREVAIQTHEHDDADASDHFDLGTAYREMGLFDKAFSEYELASKDPRWQAKALVMMGTLKMQSGDADTAVGLFGRAVEAARTKDERCEANYELASVLLVIGDIDGARAAFERVEPGYRDREQKLAEIG